MIFHNTQPHPPPCWIRPLCSQLVPSSSPRIAWKTTRTAESCRISWIRSTINFYICFWSAVALDDWQPLNNKILFVEGRGGNILYKINWGYGRISGKESQKYMFFSFSLMGEYRICFLFKERSHLWRFSSGFWSLKLYQDSSNTGHIRLSTEAMRSTVKK